MTEILRPPLRCQHPIHLVCEPGQQISRIHRSGGCGTLLRVGRPAYSHLEILGLSTRNLPRGEIGDFCVIEGAGAYCSSMAAKNYNSFPEAAEVLRKEDGRLALIRKRQTFDQIIENEVVP